MSGILSQESGEPGNAHRLWNFRPTWGSACAGQGGSPWCRVTAAKWVLMGRVSTKNLVFKTCVLVPTSRLMTLFFFFFFPQGSMILRFFTAFASLSSRPVQTLLIDLLIESSLCIEGQHRGTGPWTSHPIRLIPESCLDLKKDTETRTPRRQVFSFLIQDEGYSCLLYEVRGLYKMIRLNKLILNYWLPG